MVANFCICNKSSNMNINYFLMLLIIPPSLNGSNEIMEKNKAKLIEAYIKAHNEPRILTVFHCWGKAMIASLSKSIKKQANYIDQTGFKHYDYPLNHQTLVILDFDCPNMTLVAQTLQNRKLFVSPYKWLFLGNNLEVLEVLNDFEMLPGSDIVVAQPDSNGLVFKRCYQTCKKCSVIWSNYATWNLQDDIIQFDGNTNLVWQRRNLHEATLRTSIVYHDNETLLHLDDYIDPQIDTVTKLNYVLTNYMLAALNATPKFSYITTWGYPENNSFYYTGMIGEMQRGLTDIGGTALFITADRVSRIAFVAPTYNTKFCFIFRQPPLSYTSNVYSLPFEGRVWAAQIGLVAIIIICLWITLNWETWKHNNLMKPAPIGYDGKVTDAVVIAVGTVCQQGTSIEPTSGPARITIYTLYMLITFLFVSYSANILVMLQSTSNSIQTLSDLLNSELKVGASDQVYSSYYFRGASDPIRKGIYQRKIRQPNGSESFIPTDEGVALMRKGYYAFHADTGPVYQLVAKTFLEHEKCGLKELGNYMQVGAPYYSVQKHSPYLELFKNALRKMHERGLQARESRRFILKKPDCPGNSNFASVSLREISAPFYILVLGTMLSVALFLVEIMMQKIINNNRSVNN